MHPHLERSAPGPVPRRYPRDIRRVMSRTHPQRPFISLMNRWMMDQFTWILARARSYSLASLSSRGGEDVAVTLDVSLLSLTPSSMAWLCDIPHMYVCCMPITGYWTSYVDNGVITYYKGDLSSAKRYSLHLLRPQVHNYCQETESVFAVLLDDTGTPDSLNTLYFLDIENENELKTEISYMGPGVAGMTDLLKCEMT